MSALKEQLATVQKELETAKKEEQLHQLAMGYTSEIEYLDQQIELLEK